MRWEELKRVLSGYRVGIAGCGGLGSNAAVALARVGIRHFVLADFDRVESSNLNRQYYFLHQIGEYKTTALADNLHMIAKGITLELHQKKLEFNDIPQIFGHCHLVIEAFDKAEAKQMIAEAMLTCMPQVPLIMGNGMAGIGMFGSIRQEKWFENVYVCGDFVTEVGENTPPLAPRVGIVSNMQANLALELLVKMYADGHHTEQS
ncbi:MAG TPA: sulfur carrier protein ThiS adenylyltransferase ThiF [Bacteroidales bacterium]|nr:sulfur carrier protein ThiS adenylyltransferase ThiF [Bacteroidales bacterium]